MSDNLYKSINWEYIPNFSLSDFSENPEKYAAPELIYILQTIRTMYDIPIYPSPVSGALARFSGSETSQHYVGPKNTPIRKSTAIDIFPEGVPFLFYTTLLKFPTIKGIGIYIETKGLDASPWVMFHIDLRTKGFNKDYPLIWIAKKNSNGKNIYSYPQTDSTKWSLLNKTLFYSNRIKK